MAHIIFKDYPEKKYQCSVRLVRICDDNRLKRLADFSRMTFNEVLSLPECGKKTAMHIKRILKENGLDFCEKRRKMSVRNSIQRNELIDQMVSSGESYRKIAGQLGISTARVAQILKERRLTIGSELRV